MSEWLKILLSALSGMAASALLEPVKYWIGKRVIAREAKNALYGELAAAYYLVDSEIATEEGIDVVRRLFTETFEFYWEKKREAFYLVPNYLFIVGLFGGLTRIKRIYAKDKDSVQAAIERWKEDLHGNLVFGNIDSRLFYTKLGEVSSWRENSAKHFNSVLRRVRRKEKSKMPSIVPR